MSLFCTLSQGDSTEAVLISGPTKYWRLIVTRERRDVFCSHQSASVALVALPAALQRHVVLLTIVLSKSPSSDVTASRRSLISPTSSDMMAASAARARRVSSLTHPAECRHCLIQLPCCPATTYHGLTSRLWRTAAGPAREMRMQLFLAFR